MDDFEKKYLKHYGVLHTTTQHLYYFIGKYAPQLLARLLYKKVFRNKLNLTSPHNLNEKINWLEFKTETLIWSLLTDKLLVRKYVLMLGYESILTRLYGVWENACDVDFQALPESFVLKCNHDSGSAHIVLNKKHSNRYEIITSLNKRMSRPYGIVTAEPHYRHIKRFVFAEELIMSKDNAFEGPISYKFWCFYGEVACCHVQYRLRNGVNGDEMYRLPQWEHLPNAFINKNKIHIMHAPAQLNKMIEVASNLSRIFPECRVDLYESDNRVVFGELTFTAGGGRINDYSSVFLEELGEKVKICKGLNYTEIINGIKSYGTIKNKPCDEDFENRKSRIKFKYVSQ